MIIGSAKIIPWNIAPQMTNTSTIGEHQHAWCQLSGNNETYTCDGFYNLWDKCRANPRGFSEDPENVDSSFTHGILRHPKFATMLLGKFYNYYLYSFNLTCILFSPLHTFVFDELLYLVQIGEEQNKNFLFCIVVKLRQGSGKDRQGMAVKAKGLKD